MTLFDSVSTSRLATIVVALAMCLTANVTAEIANADDTVTVGLKGHYRVGRWTAVRVSTSAANGTNASTIETRDGDGHRVAFNQPSDLGDQNWGYVIAGSEAAPLIIRGEEDVMVSTRLPELGPPSKGPAMIPLHMPWIVAVGDALGIDQIGANELLNRDALLAVTKLTDASDFPTSHLGYDGVDMLMIGGSSIPVLESLNENQSQAISNWVHYGGRILLTLGESAPKVLESAPWIKQHLPFDPSDTVTYDPSAFETYTSSQSPLDPYEGLKIPRKVGRVLITGKTTRRVNTPVAAEYVSGLGRVTVVCGDLERPMFAEWPERTALLTRLTGKILIPRKNEQNEISRATAYNDLAGQLRSTMDQFPSKRSFSFSVASLILMGLIALIGPLDFLLVNRLVGRPLLGWFSFPIAAIGLSALLVSQARPANGGGAAAEALAPVHCNRIEFVDIDLSANTARGNTMTYVYTHPANELGIQTDASDTLDSLSSEVSDLLTAPFGYPGDAFGGIQIAIEDSRLPVFDVDLTKSNEGLRAFVNEIPMAPRSSKSFATTFRFTPDLPPQTIGQRPGSQMLRGSITNPLPVDLLDGMLVYQNGVYPLPTVFRSGDQIGAIEDELLQKNFRFQLSKQKALEETATQREDWNPARRDSLDRVAEMLMFHEAVGGTRYTSLHHDALSFLDLTPILSEQRCILVGRIAEPLTDLNLETSDGSTVTDDTLTYVRVVLPVEPRRR